MKPLHHRAVELGWLRHGLCADLRFMVCQPLAHQADGSLGRIHGGIALGRKHSVLEGFKEGGHGWMNVLIPG